MATINMKRMELFEVWSSCLGNSEEKQNSVMNFVSSYYSEDEKDTIEYREAQEITARLCREFVSRWKGCHRQKQLLLKKCSSWLDVDITFFKFHEMQEASTSQGRKGRPPKTYEICVESTKRRKIQELDDSFTKELTSDILVHKYKSSSSPDKAKIVKAVASASPLRVSRIKNSIVTPTKNPEKFTPEEALALFLDLGLSKDKYNTLRTRLQKKHHYALPSYTKITEAKLESIPPNIEVSETSASIKLQDLLDHTSRRIMKTKSKDEIEKMTTTNLVLFSKWGCDGSSGQSEYKQKIAENITDANLFMVSLVPLRLGFDSQEPSPSTASTHCEIWKNPRPSSVHFCRAIKYEYAKESKDKILQEVRHIESQISSLNPTTFNCYGKEIKIRHNLFLTMVDGKVVQSLTETKASSSCTVCQATQKQYSTEGSSSISLNEQNYQFGLSPLHARIRFMEHILHIAYDLSFEGNIRGNKENKDKRSAEKERIQKEFREELGIIIDTPKQGSGNTNDGNTARRFFQHPDKTSAITKIDADLIKRFQIILNALASGYHINAKKFGEYAKETLNLLREKYPWKMLTPTVHKVLDHGENVIKYYLLPIGELSEEAQESKNKDYKKYGYYNTRKTSRTEQNNRSKK